MRFLLLRRLIIISITLFFSTVHNSFAYEEPYCGLYSLYAALHSIGIQVEDFNDMCVPEYLSGTQGSTALDIIRLAEKYGAAGTFRNGLSVASLRVAQSPILLHTSIAVSKVGFYHWILFLGMDGNSVKLYDPPQGMYTVSSAELLSFWDGNGIVIKRPENQAIMQAWNMIPALNLELIFAFLLVFVAGNAVVRIAVLVRHPVCGILVIAILSGLTWHAIVDYGFFCNSNALANIASRFDRENVPIITIERLRELTKRQDVVIVDARRPDSYESSHVPCAINIPITATHGLLRNALAVIPVDKTIVVYCQSNECGWSDDIAHQFTARGYQNVSIFRDGMNAWNTMMTDTQ